MESMTSHNCKKNRFPCSPFEGMQSTHNAAPYNLPQREVASFHWWLTTHGLTISLKFYNASTAAQYTPV